MLAEASASTPVVMQGPGWGPSVTYLERTLSPLLSGLDLRHYPVRNTPGGFRVDEVNAQAIDKLAADLESVRAGLGAERLAIVGHSHGALIALGYAIRYPERTAALVLLGPSLVPVGSSPCAAELLERFRGDPLRRDAVAAWEKTPARGGVDLDDRALARWMRATAPLNFYDLDALAAFQLAMRDAPVPSAVALQGVAPEPEAWLRSKLGDVRAPTLVVVGREDFLTPPDAAAEVATGVGGDLVVVDRAGHNPWIERPRAVAGPIRAFLALHAGALS